MKHRRQVVRMLALISQLGISMLVPVILCTAAGVWLDDKLNVSFTVAFILLGIMAGIRNVYVILRRARDDIAADDEET